MYLKVSTMKPDFHTAFFPPPPGGPLGAVQVYMWCRGDQELGCEVKMAISIQMSLPTLPHRSNKIGLVQMQ